MRTTGSISDTQRDLTSVIAGLAIPESRHLITHDGKDVAVILGVNEYESLIETLNILSDADAVKAIAIGSGEIARGEVVPVSEVWEIEP